MWILKLTILSVLLAYAYAGCAKDKRIQLHHSSKSFHFSINGKKNPNVRSALAGSNGVYSSKKTASVIIRGSKSFRNFDYKKICFQVQGAQELDVVYESMITDPVCDAFGCSGVGPALSREMPIMFNKPASFKKICLKNRGIKSKISLRFLPAAGEQIQIRNMAMKACIFD